MSNKYLFTYPLTSNRNNVIVVVSTVYRRVKMNDLTNALAELAAAISDCTHTLEQVVAYIEGNK